VKPDDGNPFDMPSRHPTDDDRLLVGDATDPAIRRVVADIGALGRRPIDEVTAARHVEMAAGTAAEHADPFGVVHRQRPGRTPMTRLSRTATAALTLLLVASMAGTAIAADASVPGDTLYGLNRALERVGILDGGATERLQEAAAIVDRDLELAVATAQEAAEGAEEEGNDQVKGAAEALIAAAESVLSDGDEQSLAVREEVARLLQLLATQVGESGVDGEQVSEIARSIRDTVKLPDHVTLPDRDAEDTEDDTKPGPPVTVPSPGDDRPGRP